MSSTRIRLVQPVASISETMVRDLVHAFYARVLDDEMLGPIFSAALAHRWDDHLATMVDFWSSIALGTGRYGGKPHLVHQGLGLDPDHFRQWLTLFEATAVEVCGPEAAPFFADRAQRIGESLQIGLGIGPKALRLDLHPPS